jgi:phosphoribosylformylglycinamidine (FGAM) synthase-like enzyme
MRTTARLAILALGAAVVLSGCGGSAFSAWADYVLDHEVTDVKAEVQAGNARLAVECLQWQTATESKKVLAAAALSASATKAGYLSYPEDARAWLDENCAVPG